MIFKASNTKTDKLKWIIYILLGVFALIYILKYSEWPYIFKFILSIPLIINLFFDIYYLKQTFSIIENIELTDTSIIINYTNQKSKKIKFTHLKYSIRKRYFEEKKTEIELKKKFRTSARLHFKNWDKIFEIEKEIQSYNIQRVKWKPKTITAKYWGILIDVLFMTITSGEGDLGMKEVQENSINGITKNPIKKKN